MVKDLSATFHLFVTCLCVHCMHVGFEHIANAAAGHSPGYRSQTETLAGYTLYLQPHLKGKVHPKLKSFDELVTC